MSEISKKVWQSLVDEAADRNEDAMLSVLLRSVNRRKRWRKVVRTSSIITVVALAITFGLLSSLDDYGNQELPVLYTEIDSNRGWKEVDGAGNFTVISNVGATVILSVEYAKRPEMELIDDSALMDYFDDEPVMIARVGKGASKLLLLGDIAENNSIN